MHTQTDVIGRPRGETPDAETLAARKVAAANMTAQVGADEVMAAAEQLRQSGGAR